MLTYHIPGRRTVHLSALVLDLNGTLCIDGRTLPGLAERISAFKAQGVSCFLLTADTRGRGAEIAAALELTLNRLQPGDEQAQKTTFVEQLGPDSVAAIGNGMNDVGMLKAAAIGIAVLQAEGLAVEALHAADVLVPDICAALDLLLHPQRLIATIRH
jgi:P-type E1-E2 ATPase